MDPVWRWRSMASKGAARVDGSELAFAISSAPDARAVENGLQALSGAWGAEALAELLGSPAFPESFAGRPGKGSSTVLGQIAMDVGGPGLAHPGWSKLGAALDFGANPEAAPKGCRSPIDQMCAQVQYGVNPQSCPEREAVRMMLSKCESAAEGEWVAKLSEEYPAVAALCAREWASRQRREIDASTQQAETSKEWAPRL